MTTMKENVKQYYNISDNAMAKIIKLEAHKLREALGAHDYDRIRYWAKEMALTLVEINKNLEGRKND